MTTIAGGKSNVVGYRDGPSEDAKFSSDFDVIYVKATCSLLVIDRGNAALRQISLDKEDCNYQYSSTSATGSDCQSTYVFLSIQHISWLSKMLLVLKFYPIVMPTVVA